MNFAQKLSRSCFHILGSPGAPVEILYLIGQHHSSCPQLTRDGNLKRVTFLVVSDWNCNRQTSLSVICTRGKDNCGTPAALFVACHWIHVYFDNVAYIWNVAQVLPHLFANRFAP